MLTLTPTSVGTHSFTDEHFGANFLFHRDRLGEDGTYDEAISALGVGHVRYPGGAVTEKYFDLSNPDATTAIDSATGETVNLLPFSDFIDFAQQNDLFVSVVLPTSNYLSTETDSNGHRFSSVDETEVRKFISDTLSGTYGDANIQSFQIGNEYWGAGMTSVEYGRVASEMASIVSDEIAKYSASTGQDLAIDVIVQMGMNYGSARLSDEFADLDLDAQKLALQEAYGISTGDGDIDWSAIANELILKEFDTPQEIASVDAVDAHLYYKGEDAPWSLDRPLKLINESNWDETFGPDLERYVSEWNLSSSADTLDKSEDYGLKAAKSLLAIAEIFPDNHVDAAHVWPVQQNTATDLAYDEGEEGLTIQGEMFAMMAASLPGTRQLRFSDDDNPGSGALTDPETGDEVHAFASESGVELFVFAGENTDGVVSLDVSNLVQEYGGVRIEKISVGEGENPGGSSSSAIVTELPAQDIVSDMTFDVPVLPHEIIHVSLADIQATDMLAGLMDEAIAREMIESQIEDGADGPIDQQYIGQYGDAHDASVLELVSDQTGDPLVDNPAEPPPPENYERETASSGGGCFVATAVYGDRDHPEVVELRRFRDEVLARFALGRRFIAFYYRYGPVWAAYVARRDWLRIFFRIKISCLVGLIRLIRARGRVASD